MASKRRGISQIILMKFLYGLLAGALHMPSRFGQSFYDRPEVVARPVVSGLLDKILHQ